MGTFIYFTDEQKRRANAVDLPDFLRRRGEKLIRSGREFRLASDHSITVRGDEWFDHASCEGGRAVSFAQRFYKLSFPEAITLLLGGEQDVAYQTVREQEESLPKPFELPPPNKDMRRVFAYLIRRRRIDRKIVSAFAKTGLIYEDAEHHNCVFVGRDENGVARHAHKRSTNTMRTSFRINVEGSLPQYSFHYAGEDEQLYVFEAPIDLFSYIALHPEGWLEHSYVALCGTGGQAMLWILEQYPQLKTVWLGLDNDKAGQDAGERLQKEVQEAGYQCGVLLPALKDWNDDLCAERELPAPVMAME